MTYCCQAKSKKQPHNQLLDWIHQATLTDRKEVRKVLGKNIVMSLHDQFQRMYRETTVVSEVIITS